MAALRSSRPSRRIPRSAAYWEPRSTMAAAWAAATATSRTIIPWRLVRGWELPIRSTPRPCFAAGSASCMPVRRRTTTRPADWPPPAPANTQTSFGFPVTTLAQGYPDRRLSAGVAEFQSGPVSRPPLPIPGPFGGAFMDPNAGRPARQYQWSVGFQREITKDMVVEASYVANRGVWWQAPALLNLNAITPARSGRPSASTSITPADLTLLTSLLNSPTAAQRGFNLSPYPGFPLRPDRGASLAAVPAIQRHDSRVLGSAGQELVRFASGEGHQAPLPWPVLLQHLRLVQGA